MSQGQEQSGNDASEFFDVRILSIQNHTKFMGDIRGIFAIDTNGFNVDVYGTIEQGVLILGDGQVTVHAPENLG